MFCVVYKLIFAVLMMSDSRQFGTYRASFWSKNSHQLGFLSPLELKNIGYFYSCHIRLKDNQISKFIFKLQ